MGLYLDILKRMIDLIAIAATVAIDTAMRAAAKKVQAVLRGQDRFIFFIMHRGPPKNQN
jgi:uncharacterized protein (DUF58 family)